MYQVMLQREAKKDLRKLEKRFREKIFFILSSLKNNPFLGEKMAREFSGSYRIKIPPLRIIYTPDLKRKIIWIRTLGFRGRVYK
ncbi:hypothetical protein FJY90_07880 [Candidatus Gottesmanbacteria bacterium]|nr:hypothetical protein [Candidatus Gottesmanbacteria bacterium]